MIGLHEDIEKGIPSLLLAALTKLTGVSDVAAMKIRLSKVCCLTIGNSDIPLALPIYYQ